MPYIDLEKKKEYSKKYNKEHHPERYKKYKETFKLNSDYNKKRNTLAYLKEKSKYSCVECGEDHLACLEFHHTDRSKKEGDVSTLIGCSFEKAFKEMKKCIVLCSNCHKKEHWDDNKIEKLKAELIEIEIKKKELRERRRKERKTKDSICRGCNKSNKEIEFVAGRNFCRKCYREYQKEKMKLRRKKQS